MEDMDSIVERLKTLYGRTTATSSEEPKYKCDRCHDNGWIESQDDKGYRFVVKCACQLAREAEERLAVSGLADVVEKQTFDTFRTETRYQAFMYGTAWNYLNRLLGSRDNPRKPWLYVGGNPGSGKTHICTAVCGELLRHNVGVRYMQWLEDSRKLKYSVNDEHFEDLVTDYTNVSVLYIDDLLKQKYVDRPVFTEADIKVAFTILNARYIRNKPTIISSEWDLLEQLLPADEGVFSRVYERCKGFTISIERCKENNYRLYGGGAE